MADPTFWTEEREGLARKLFDEGLSGSLAAVQLSLAFRSRVTRNAVIGLWHRRQWSGGKYIQPKTRAKPVEPRKRSPRPRLMIIKANSVGAVRIVSTVDAPLVPVKIANVVPRHVSLDDLTRDTCRYPYGDGPFTFCGCEVVTGPYCVPHAALCFNENQGEKRAESEKRKREYLRSQRAA